MTDIRQFIKFEVFVADADLEVIPEEEGKKAISGLDLATSGNCGKRPILRIPLVATTIFSVSCFIAGPLSMEAMVGMHDAHNQVVAGLLTPDGHPKYATFGQSKSPT